MLASTKNGKQVLNVSGNVEAQVCTPVAGDSVAVVGDNRKLLIFPLSEIAGNDARQGRRSPEIP